jgi:hypothetical protein
MSIGGPASRGHLAGSKPFTVLASNETSETHQQMTEGSLAAREARNSQPVLSTPHGCAIH